MASLSWTEGDLPDCGSYSRNIEITSILGSVQNGKQRPKTIVLRMFLYRTHVLQLAKHEPLALVDLDGCTRPCLPSDQLHRGFGGTVVVHVSLTTVTRVGFLLRAVI